MTAYVYVSSVAPRQEQTGALSPELVLVDPVLADAARSRLPDPGPPLPFRRPSQPPELTFPSRREAKVATTAASRRTLIGLGTIALVALFVVALLDDDGPPSTPVAQQPTPPTILETTPLAKPPTAPAGADRANAPSGPKSKPSRTPTKTRTPAARRFAWAPVAGASGYHVEFFREGRRVFARETTEPQVTLPSHWTYDGAATTLRAGRYQWYVWPIISGRRQAQAAVQTTVTVPGA